MIFRLTGACSFDDGLADVASGTTTQIISADATVTAARMANSPRQPPLQSSNSSAGEVALNAPRVPSMTIQPFIEAVRSFGNHRTIALSPPVTAAATPRPIRARPRTSAANPFDMLNSMAPAAANNSSAPWTRRGP
jgi:hypothetical protein